MANQVGLWIKQRWRLLLLLFVPLILLPLPILNNSPQSKCGYIVFILVIYWIFEIIPLPVTSLLPLILFPMAGVLKANVVAPKYFQDIIALFFGSLSLAYAVESVNLHRRMALFVLSLVGTSTKWAMGGLMVVTAFLSMWINNSSAASIMLPVALAISDTLEHHEKDYPDKKRAITDATVAVNEIFDSNETEASNGHTTEQVVLDAFHIEESPIEVMVIDQVDADCRLPSRNEAQVKRSKPHEKKSDEIKKAFLLAVAYSATIGGLGSLVGTTPNIYVKGFVDEQYKDTNFRITFLTFLLFAFPVAVLMLILCWLWLQLLYNKEELFQCRTKPETREVQSNLKAMLVQQYNDLGKPNWNEYSVGIIFILMVILWVTRQFSDTSGWEILFEKEYISDSTVAVFCGILPLILPNSNPFKNDWKYEPIIQWNNLVKNLAWSPIFLLGAGLSVASAFETSGLSNTIAQTLGFLTGLPRTAVIVLIIVISGLFTEVASNLSTVTIFLPVLNSIAQSSGIHPAFLILPCTLAVSLAFMLPIATPPNAIIFGSGAIRVIDMIKTGAVMNIIGFLVIFLSAMTWMPKIYGLNDRTTEIFFGNSTTSFGTTLTARG